MKKTANKTASKSKSATVKRASRILTDQKKEYQRIFIRETKRGGDTKNAAKRAGVLYRSKFGSTPEIRWKKALKSAKCR